ncbi:outer membrane protein [Microvirga makkahensis]|uniref:Outer membrane beta-barrel protein n=1 Tax=Microvirga makkahensis TaxID=1128670 RepID=A0A7X3MSU1_9HYPH|nr:outer membrane protein [Microvirga makkahensis]MXQ12450.1 outer membrane beta-barrel protein [Microvirga makkahensis]
MKKILLSSVALLGLTAGAMAADLPSRYAPAPVVAAVPVFTWTGFYVGAQAGYAWGEDEARVLVDGVDVTPTFVVGGTDFDTDGFVGGVHAGYNVQFGSFVVGLEGDIEAAGIDGDRTFNDVLVAGDAFTTSTDINFQGSLRARAGVAFDRALVYATGGLAFANFENTYSYNNGAGTIVTEDFDDTQWGWTIGAGVEYAFTNNLTARVEYRYTQFDNFDNESTLVAGGAIEQEPEFHTVRVGLSYKFGTY